MSVKGFDVNAAEDLLPTYYKRLFPTKLLFQWLSYGDRQYFMRREWSFVLKDDVYLRYKSFSDASELERQIRCDIPFKIDLGAVYNHPPRNHKTVASFEAEERELVFDIDLTDYDDVRTCCSGSDMCKECWMYMVVAVKILDSALKDDFGYKHCLWVYSGRRGVHCWVCDKSARCLSSSARATLVEYLSVVVGGEFRKKKVSLPRSEEPLHPLIARSLGIIQNHFDRFLHSQAWLDSEEKWAEICSIISSDESTQQHLVDQFSKIATSSSKGKWDKLCQFAKKNLSKNTDAASSNEEARPIQALMLQLVYPRLDANVSKTLNHLLKSPFCVHPKTGKVSIPFSVETIDTFDYDNVPRIDTLLEELRQSDCENFEAKSGQNAEEQQCKRKEIDYKKTSLRDSVDVFQNFLRVLCDDRVPNALTETNSNTL